MLVANERRHIFDGRHTAELSALHHDRQPIRVACGQGMSIDAKFAMNLRLIVSESDTHARKAEHPERGRPVVALKAVRLIAVPETAEMARVERAAALVASGAVLRQMGKAGSGLAGRSPAVARGLPRTGRQPGPRPKLPRLRGTKSCRRIQQCEGVSHSAGVMLS